MTATPLSAPDLRQALSQFATGVTVITSFRKSGELHGLTANAFTSVSLEPPLLLICVDKKADSYPCFDEVGVFTVNILATDQEALSRRFAVSGGNKFEGVAYHLGGNGAPILEGTLGHIECRVTARHEGGDHTIYVGAVQEAETREHKPLLFFRGGYREIGD